MSDSKKSLSKPNSDRKRVLIQIDEPSNELDIIQINNLLKDTGIELDMKYGPFSINPSKSKVVVRGYADEKSQEKASKIKGVLLFPEFSIKPDVNDQAT